MINRLFRNKKINKNNYLWIIRIIIKYNKTKHL